MPMRNSDKYLLVKNYPERVLCRENLSIYRKRKSHATNVAFIKLVRDAKASDSLYKTHKMSHRITLILASHTKKINNFVRFYV